MPFEPNDIEWNKDDPKPDQTKVDEGWKADEKPPASMFNWFFNRTANAIRDLIANAIHKDEKGRADGVATLDSINKIPNAQLRSAATSGPGIVQLNDATNSTSTTQAATANAVKKTYDLANGRATRDVATTSANGLMSAADKTKLDGVAANANNYTHPATHPASMITESATRRFVTDTEKETWNAKASTAVATTTANGLMSSADKTKLNGIETGANKYTHPATHPATMITEDASHRFVTDNEKATWNAKASTSVATTSANGLMSSADKVKLNGIAAGAQANQNAFSHVKVGSTNVSADSATDTLEIVGGSNVTVTPDATNDKLTISAVNTTYGVATTSANGLMSSSDKSKLNGIETGAQKNAVTSVNGLTGAVSLNAGHVGAIPATGGTVTGDILFKPPAGGGSTYLALYSNGDVSALGEGRFSKGVSSNGYAVDEIVSRGSNANGEFVRYSSGLQICWAQPFTLVMNTPTGSIYRSVESEWWTYPAAFKGSEPVGLAAGISAVSRWASISGVPTGSGAAIRGYSSITGETPYSVWAVAIGRWK